MATDTREQPPSPTVAMGFKEADAKMVVATSHGDCQKLKDLVQQQDHPTTTMLVVMASGEQQASAEEKPPRRSMHPLLAAAACKGNLEELRFILLSRREQKQIGVKNLSLGFLHQAKAYKIINDGSTASATTTMGQQATANSSDVEQGGGVDAVVPLVEGVTVEGDTVLHLVAANGEEDNFLACAAFIHGLEGGGSLLCKENYNGDTPLHCAARVGRTKMVSRLIDHAKKDNGIEEHLLIRKENNRNETALHEAVRAGDNDLVTALLTADGELARYPEGNKYASPLYLAIALGRIQIAKTLHHDESKTEVAEDPSPTRNQMDKMHCMLLFSEAQSLQEWCCNGIKVFTTERDKNGSTPLHFAARHHASVFSKVLKANPTAVYQPDNDGLYPIHVAASFGAKQAIELIVKKCGGTNAGLRDAKGRTFLHVAVGEGARGIVGYACGNRSLTWIMNMQDNNGNTALHLAVEAGSLRMFSLVGNRHVELNLVNAERETPLDIAHYKIPQGCVSARAQNQGYARHYGFSVL